MNKDKYNQFIDSLELIEEFIPESSWKRHIKEINPDQKINLDIKLKKVKPEIFSKMFICGHTLTIKGLDQEKNLHFQIKGTILLKIVSRIDIDEECVKFYAENTVQLSTIPAFRSFVKEALIKMGLPPFTLPFLKRHAQGVKKNN